MYVEKLKLIYFSLLLNRPSNKSSGVISKSLHKKNYLFIVKLKHTAFILEIIGLIFAKRCGYLLLRHTHS